MMTLAEDLRWLEIAHDLIAKLAEPREDHGPFTWLSDDDARQARFALALEVDYVRGQVLCAIGNAAKVANIGAETNGNEN